MANRRIDPMDVLELIRLLRAKQSTRAITRLLGHNRRTIARYRAWAEAQGLLDGPLPTAAQVQYLLTTTLPALVPPQQTSSVASFADEIVAYRAQGMELAAIKGRLEERHGQPRPASGYPAITPSGAGCGAMSPGPSTRWCASKSHRAARHRSISAMPA
jgi:hypothetical protein